MVSFKVPRFDLLIDSPVKVTPGSLSERDNLGKVYKYECFYNDCFFKRSGSPLMLSNEIHVCDLHCGVLYKNQRPCFWTYPWVTWPPNGSLNLNNSCLPIIKYFYHIYLDIFKLAFRLPFEGSWHQWLRPKIWPLFTSSLPVLVMNLDLSPSMSSISSSWSYYIIV